MSDDNSRPLAGRKALVLGIANEHSIAYGCARAFRRLGADLAITYARRLTGSTLFVDGGLSIMG